MSRTAIPLLSSWWRSREVECDDALAVKRPASRPTLASAGQPCVLCHDGDGPGNMVPRVRRHGVSDAERPKGARRRRIHFRDACAGEYWTATNCAGNFFVADGDYRPTWPVFVRVEYSVTLVLQGTTCKGPADCPPPATCGPAGACQQVVPVVGRMTSPIYDTDGSTVAGLRDRSCAHCHSDPADSSSSGHIYLAPEGATIPFPQVPCR
jgi:hypothetical protein